MGPDWLGIETLDGIMLRLTWGDTQLEKPAEYKIDKTAWERGPWDSEPDRIDFVHAGLACLALRNHHGNWCGYVGVPPEHPAYGKSYGDVDVDVDGGLTYARRCEEPICHISQPGMPDDVYWLGFDCGHAWDLTPAWRMERIREEVYRDLPFVMREIKSLAQQLAALLPAA